MQYESSITCPHWDTIRNRDQPTDAGAVAKVVGNWKRRGLRKHEGIVSGGEVNGLSDRRGGERLPSVDLSHVDLS